MVCICIVAPFGKRCTVVIARYCRLITFYMVCTCSKAEVCSSVEHIQIEICFNEGNESTKVAANGNGSLDAFSNALKSYSGKDYELLVYSEHSMQEQGSGSIAAAYIGIKDKDGNMSWGVGTDTDIIHAGANALLSAFVNMERGN